MRNPASAADFASGRAHGAASADQDPGSAEGRSADSGSALVMEFDTLAAVAGPLASSAPAVRGISGGGLPWAIDVGSGSLSCDGHLRVRIRGLVLASDPSVPASLRATNPFPSFRAIVSYLSSGLNGSVAVTRVSTGDFAASPEGDADIDVRVSIPHPCVAPIVLITGPSGTETWLAATAF